MGPLSFSYLFVDAKNDEQAFQDQLQSLRSLLQETYNNIKTTLESAQNQQQITGLYRFGVELLGWVTIIAQFWVDHQKKKTKKEKRGEWTKAIEPFVTAALELTTSLSTLIPQEPQHKEVPEFLNTKELQAALETVKQEVSNSHKSSQSSIAGLLSSRSKMLKVATLSHN